MSSTRTTSEQLAHDFFEYTNKAGIPVSFVFNYIADTFDTKQNENKSDIEDEKLAEFSALIESVNETSEKKFENATNKYHAHAVMDHFTVITNNLNLSKLEDENDDDFNHRIKILMHESFMDAYKAFMNAFDNSAIQNIISLVDIKNSVLVPSKKSILQKFYPSLLAKNDNKINLLRMVYHCSNVNSLTSLLNENNEVQCLLKGFVDNLKEYLSDKNIIVPETKKIEEEKEDYSSQLTIEPIKNVAVQKKNQDKQLSNYVQHAIDSAYNELHDEYTKESEEREKMHQEEKLAKQHMKVKVTEHSIRAQELNRLKNKFLLEQKNGEAKIKQILKDMNHHIRVMNSYLVHNKIEDTAGESLADLNFSTDSIDQEKPIEITNNMTGEQEQPIMTDEISQKNITPELLKTPIPTLSNGILISRSASEPTNTLLTTQSMMQGVITDSTEVKEQPIKSSSSVHSTASIITLTSNLPRTATTAVVQSHEVKAPNTSNTNYHFTTLDEMLKSSIVNTIDTDEKPVSTIAHDEKKQTSEEKVSELDKIIKREQLRGDWRKAVAAKDKAINWAMGVKNSLDMEFKELENLYADIKSANNKETIVELMSQDLWTSLKHTQYGYRFETIKDKSLTLINDKIKAFTSQYKSLLMQIDDLLYTLPKYTPQDSPRYEFYMLLKEMPNELKISLSDSESKQLENFIKNPISMSDDLLKTLQNSIVMTEINEQYDLDTAKNIAIYQDTINSIKLSNCQIVMLTIENFINDTISKRTFGHHKKTFRDFQTELSFDKIEKMKEKSLSLIANEYTNVCIASKLPIEEKIEALAMNLSLLDPRKKDAENLLLKSLNEFIKLSGLDITVQTFDDYALALIPIRSVTEQIRHDALDQAMTRLKQLDRLLLSPNEQKEALRDELLISKTMSSKSTTASNQTVYTFDKNTIHELQSFSTEIKQHMRELIQFKKEQDDFDKNIITYCKKDNTMQLHLDDSRELIQKIHTKPTTSSVAITGMFSRKQAVQNFLNTLPKSKIHHPPIHSNKK